MPTTQGQWNQMILDELKGLRHTVNVTSVDVAVVKEKVGAIEEQQDEMSERLKALEAKPSFALDNKTLLKIVAIIAGAIIGSIRGLPEGAWKALIGILGG